MENKEEVREEQEQEEEVLEEEFSISIKNSLTALFLFCVGAFFVGAAFTLGEWMVEFTTTALTTWGVGAYAATK